MRYPNLDIVKLSGQAQEAAKGQKTGTAETAQGGSVVSGPKRRKRQLTMKVSFSDEADVDYRDAARAFAKLLVPDLAAALRDTREILNLTDDNQHRRPTDLINERKLEIQKQMSDLKAELLAMEES